MMVQSLLVDAVMGYWNLVLALHLTTCHHKTAAIACVNILVVNNHVAYAIIRYMYYTGPSIALIPFCVRSAPSTIQYMVLVAACLCLPGQ